tara:strand:+ start:40617 stop:40766 length:150 start_codon:yes stop_codon:yes gene_type:complete
MFIPTLIVLNHNLFTIFELPMNEYLPYIVEYFKKSTKKLIKYFLILWSG